LIHTLLEAFPGTAPALGEVATKCQALGGRPVAAEILAKFVEVSGNRDDFVSGLPGFLMALKELKSEEMCNCMTALFRAHPLSRDEAVIVIEFLSEFEDYLEKLLDHLRLLR
jgi:hypothetical protein